MLPKLQRCLVGAALLLVAASTSVAEIEAAVRATPVRPAAKAAPSTATLSTSGKTLSVSEIATKLGLKVSWPQPGVKVALADGPRRIVLEKGSRETLINGLRVFLGSPVSFKGGQFHVSDVDFTTCLVPLLKPSLVPRRPSRPKLIAIDAGHGGIDDGTENRRLKMKEKTYTLDVSRRLKSLLEKDGYKVVLTRAADVTMDKATRVSLANRAGADVFVSIHFNALPNDQKTRGTEVFTFAPQHQRSTNSWGAFQADDTERGIAPGNRFDPWNSLLAHSLHRELLSRLKTFDRGKKIAHLGVLRGLECPGVLVESGFLSHDEEAQKISTPAHRQEIAAALAAGIQSYASQIDAMRSKR